MCVCLCCFRFVYQFFAYKIFTKKYEDEAIEFTCGETLFDASISTSDLTLSLGIVQPFETVLSESSTSGVVCSQEKPSASCNVYGETRCSVSDCYR